MGSRWVTERELRRHSIEARGLRVPRGFGGQAPAAEGGADRPGQLRGGTPHVPDGVLVSPAGEPVAIEVELTRKSRASYRRIMRWYATSGQQAYGRVLWYAGTPAILRLLRATIAHNKLDLLISAELLPPSVLVRRWW